MTLEASESESPFAHDPDPETASSGAAGEGGPDWNPFGLRNSHPPLRPAEIGSQLDVEAEWWQHHLVGFIKQAEGTDDVEAWMNHAMGLILLVQTLLGDETQRSRGTEEAEEGETWSDQGTANVEIFEGPQ